MTVSITVKSQTQSMQLPIPSESGSVINFIDPVAPAITNLPAHAFYINNDPTQIGDPHDELHLQDPTPPMFEKYLGQHPMFGQTVVHDNDGNLLFFIVDNNIYNRYGEEFTNGNSSFMFDVWHS